MAGVKGRSGGARPNSGPKPKKAVLLPDSEGMEPLDFLLWVQNSGEAPLTDRIRAATAAAQYRHAKIGEGGKKDREKDRAKDAAAGRLGALPPPRLVSNGG